MIIAVVGIAALYALFIWLIITIVCQYLSDRKGYGEKIGLASGLLLTVVGVSCLPLLARWARTAMCGLAVAVTCFGLVWLSARSHDVGRTAEALSRRPEPVLVSRVGHLLREAGWYADGRRWLTAPARADVEQAARVAADSGATSFALVDRFGADPPVLPGWTAVGTDRLRFISDVYLGVTTYQSNISSANPSS